MVTCPWCGTNYLAFQPNCKNCGGPLPAPSADAAGPEPAADEIPSPGQPPRRISDRYAWRILLADGWWIAALVFGLIGTIFFLVGAGLLLGIVTAIVGVIFLFLGMAFLGAGGTVFFWRYQAAQKTVGVLRDGIAVVGEITDLQQNYSVTINGRHPWIIAYAYAVRGQTYAARVNTLNQPGLQLRAGRPVRILYLPGEPQRSSIYPHP
jgi:hypothetical protein